MTLLIGLIVFGSLIMTNLIIAIIVTDVKKLATDAKEQVLFNKVTAMIIKQLSSTLLQANHAVHTTMLMNYIYWIVGLIVKKQGSYR